MKFKHTDLSIENKLPKLIRDKIPEIIKKNSGNDADIYVAKNDEEYMKFILKKIVEEGTEMKEYTNNQNLAEEIADLTELLDSLMELIGLSREELNEIMKSKRDKNGGFMERLIMISNGSKS